MMPREIHRLTDAVVRRLTKPGMHNDGNGLYLKVKPGREAGEAGTKSWVLRFKRGLRPDGKPRSHFMGLGPYPAVSLAAAREKADKARRQLRDGVNPVEQHKVVRAAAARQALDFETAVERYLAAHESSWKNPKHRQQWRNTLTTYAFPAFGKKAIAAIELDDVLQVLEPIWREKPETASRVRGRIETVLDWATVRGLRKGENPARWRGHLKHVLPARNKKRSVRHHPAMAWREVPGFVSELQANSAISARALEFTILTACRTSEALEATWPEFDLDNAVWVVPASRMKASTEHRVPLTAQALDILQALPRSIGSDYVFPGARRGRPLSNMAMLELLRGMRPGLTVHGFRSSFRDWAAECTSFPREIAEAALAHIVGSEVERAYRRGDLFEKRRELMRAWAEFLSTPGEPQKA